MGVISKIRFVAADPVLAGYAALSRLHPSGALTGYRAKAAQAGLDRLYLVLSFDCDTPEDIEVARDVHERLLQLGICASYAVPGALLEQGADVYRRIAATGAEFLNHGGRSHTYFDMQRGEYRSNFFYDQQPREVLKRDIEEGNRIVTEVIGKKPDGYRTPHFGTFQRPDQLQFLHEVLRDLHYTYSTSTTPFAGLRYGPAFKRYGLTEFPISGQGSNPLSILDSWGCFRAPDRTLQAEDYKREALGMARHLASGPGILNFYADPCHVAGQPIFFETMAELARMSKPVAYRDLMELVS
jgi:peptidoglycan/xylan/chitin deacetylase (PgdA/CDA1 family)